MSVAIAEIIREESDYPRDNVDNSTVELYRLNIDRLPPILITEDKRLVDGYHRLLAYRLEGKTSIPATIITIPKDATLLELAIKYNSSHGKQLTRDEKRHLAMRLGERDYTQERISEILAVARTTISLWLADQSQAKRGNRDRVIREMVLADKSQKEITDKTGLSHSTMSEIVGNVKSDIERESTTKVPESLQITNVWRFQGRDERYGLKHPGNIPGQIVENLLYYFTKPLDLVVDPMAGGGVTVDVCKAMGRRYRAYDIDPKRDDITKWDIKTGYPGEAKDADLIFLDPPYGNMVFDFFKDTTAFGHFLDKLAADSKNTLRNGGILGVLMMDQTEGDLEVFSGECYRRFYRWLKPLYGISCPQSAEYRVPQYVEKMKSEKRMLGINRQLWVFQRDKTWKPNQTSTVPDT